MNFPAIEAKAAEIRSRLGGTIISFPVEEENPFSRYAITVFMGEGYQTFLEPLTAQETAMCILQTLQGFREAGFDDDYERNVRFAFGEAQMNAPDVAMRQLKKLDAGRAPLEPDVDVAPNPDDPDSLLFSTRGVLKLSLLGMIDKNPKGIQFMDAYYRLLASKRYGKTAAAIKQEVRRTDRQEALRWAERTFKQYATDDEVFGLMQGLSG